jgi:glutamate--cysteine ligase
MLLWAFEPGMGFERYVDWALAARMVYVYRQHRFVAIKSGGTFQDFMAGGLQELPGGCQRAAGG